MYNVFINIQSYDFDKIRYNYKYFYIILQLYFSKYFLKQSADQTINMEYKIQKFSLAADKNDPIINL